MEIIGFARVLFCLFLFFRDLNSESEISSPPSFLLLMTLYKERKRWNVSRMEDRVINHAERPSISATDVYGASNFEDGALITRERTADIQSGVRPQSLPTLSEKTSTNLAFKTTSIDTAVHLFDLWRRCPFVVEKKKEKKKKGRGRERRKEKNEKPKRRRRRRKMKRIMYFHLFQSNNPALPVENVDSRISLVTTLGWISRVQLLSFSPPPPPWPAISIDFYSKLAPPPR